MGVFLQRDPQLQRVRQQQKQPQQQQRVQQRRVQQRVQQQLHRHLAASQLQRPFSQRVLDLLVRKRAE